VIHCEVSTVFKLPPPLRGRVREGGMPHTPVDERQRARAKQSAFVTRDPRGGLLAIRQSSEQVAPPTLTLPRKGGGNGESQVPDDTEGKL